MIPDSDASPGAVPLSHLPPDTDNTLDTNNSSDNDISPASDTP